MKRSVLRWELIGIAVIFLLGSALHFTFEWSGRLTAIGFFAPVNESVFEHLKLTFWPTLIFAAITYKWLKPHVNNFAPAKALAIYAMPLIVIAVFYSYTAFTGDSIVAVDILTFFIAVAAGQLAGYRILKMSPLPRWLSRLALFSIVMLALIYGLFTFFSPHVPFFMDSNTSTYGIP